MIYRLLLGTLLFNESVDGILDALLDRCMSSGIKELTIEHYLASCTFNNGITYNFWNANKYYGWLSEGSFTHGGDAVYSYKDARPKIKTMYLFRNRINKAFNQSVVTKLNLTTI